MNTALALNAFFGSAIIITLIFVECLIKFPNDKIQKNFFCSFLFITFFFLTLDFILTVINKNPVFIMFSNDIIRIAINYIPILFALLIILFIQTTYKQTYFILFLFLFLFTVSLGFNVILLSSKVVWTVMTALLLFTYLFIIVNESKTDSLTGLNNRSSFFEFAKKLSRFISGESWSIVLININNFKSINNVYGHLEGDIALRTLSNIIKINARKADFTARYGGDEFVIITRSENNLEDLITIIIEKLDSYNTSSEKPYNLEINYGSGVFTSDGSISIDDFLKHLDEIIRNNSGKKPQGEEMNPPVNRRST